MQTEIEATFLETDHDEMRAKLKELGAELSKPVFDMKRTVFDYDDLRLDKKAAWIRVRQEADKVTLTYKQRLAEEIDGMKEIELEVSSFEDTCKFFLEIGLKEKASQETRREVWRYENCEIMLDEWPWIPTYVEVEGPDEISVQRVSEALGFDYSKAIFDSADGVYMNYFDVTRTEISTVPIVFGATPDWLEAKRKV